jgi:multiple sugar transport system ATP-binding protein
MAHLVIRNLHKRFQTQDKARTIVPAVKNFNLEAEKGELIVLVGPSGCGKTTTLRMIAGLEDPTEGEIIIDGRDVTGMHPKDRDIAMVFQDYALYPHMSVRENLAFGLENARIEKATIAQRVAEVSEFLDLTTLMARQPRELSGGQRQRVAVGRALVRKPKAILLDEPLSNLDAKLRVQTRKNIIDIHKRLNSVMVYVTHDQVEAMTLGTRIVVMNFGEILQIADPHTLYTKPANTFVAGFIGTPPMNLIEGEVVDGRTIRVDGAQLAIGLPSAALAARVGKKITLGIRPEHIRETEREGENVVRAKPDFVEFLGEQTYVHFYLGGAYLISRYIGDQAPAEGLDCLFEFQAAKLHAFDAETGTRIELARGEAS